MAFLNNTIVNGKLAVNGAISENGTLLSNKYAAASHSHSWDSITGKPSSFTPSSHTHGALTEAKLTKTNITTYMNTSANIHTTGTNEQVSAFRFFDDSGGDGSSYDQPVADMHVLSFAIDGNINWQRLLALDIRSNDIYARQRSGSSNTWTSWQRLAFASEIPTNTNQLTNGAGFLTSHQSLSGYATETWVNNKGYIQNAGSSPNMKNGTAVTQPGGTNAISIKTPGSASDGDTGIFYLSDDNAYICNSSDNGYTFAVFDKDRGTDFSSADNAAFVVKSDHGGIGLKGGISLTGSITNLAIGGGLYWNPYVESSTDGSDAASITVTKDGNGSGGTVLEIKQANDAGDIIKLTAGDVLKNGNSIVDWGSVHSGRNNSANKIVRTDGNGFIQCGYINSSDGDENNASSPARVWGTNGSDHYLRTYQTGSLSVGYAASAGSAPANGGTATALSYSGMNTACFTCYQTPDAFKNNSGWTTYLIGNHENGDTYYNQIIGLRFWSQPIYGRAEGDGNTVWRSFICDEGDQTISSSLTVGGNVYASSDRRLKCNFKKPDIDFIELINTLKLKEFNFKTQENKEDKYIGLIAQNLQSKLPIKYRNVLVNSFEKDPLNGDHTTYLTINEGKFPYLLLGGIQELTRENNKLKKQNEKLKEEVKSLKKDIKQIKKALGLI